MALDPKKLQEVKKLLEDIESAYKSIGKTNPFRGMDPDKIASSEKEIKKLEVALDGALSKAQDLEDGFGGISAAIGSSLAEMNKTDSAVNRTVKSMRGIRSITQDLANDQAGLSQLSLKELKNRESKLLTLSKEARTQSELVRQQYEGFNLDKNGNKLSGAALDARLKKLNISKSEAQKIEEILAAEEEGLTVLDDALDKTKERIKYEESINKKLGITGGLLKGISKIPILSDVFDANEAVSEMDEHLRAGGSSAGALGVGIKNIGKQMKEGILNSSNMIVGVFTFMVKSLMDMDKNAGKMAKSLNISYENALDLDQTLRDVAVTSGDTALSSARLGESLMSINSAFGTTAQISNENLATFTKLREQAGMTNEELVGVYQYSALTGKSMEDVVNSFQGSAKAASFQSKVALNTKKLMADISKISSRMKLSIDGGADGLANAAVNAKLLGADIDKVSASAEALLNFEQSIEDELSAELLLGKNINLEKARTAALNNDIATLSSEIKDQVGSAAEFGDMNRIQQEAIAKSVGMSADSLADMLFEQEALASLGQQLNDEEQRAFEAAKEKYGIEEASRMLQEGQLENLVNQQSTAEQFSQTIERLKELFVSIMDGPFGALLKGMESLLSNAGAAYTIFGLIAAIMGGKMLIGLGKTIAQLGVALGLSTAKAAAEITAASALTLGLGTIGIMAAAAAAIGGLYALTKPKPVKDAAIDPKGGLIVSGPKGTYQGDPEDTVMMGTGIGKGKGKPTPPPQGGGGGTVNVDMTQTNALLQQLINVIQSGGTVTLDGQKVGEALKLGSFQTQ